MATLFGENANSTQPNGSARFSHSRLRNSFLYYDCDTTAPGVGDILPIAFLKSSDRVRDLRVYVIDNDSTTGTADIGLYTVEYSNGSTSLTAVDEDLFETTPFVLNADIAFPGTDIITAGPLTDVVRHQPLWEVAGASSDPGETYAICFTFRAAVDGADKAEIFAEVEYVAGD